MVKQADSGAWSIIAAVAAALAPVMAKALIARRRRAPLEEQTMCRNHSHLTGSLVKSIAGLDDTVVAILVEQPLTLELSSGSKLTLPAFTVCLLRQEHPGVWSDSELRATAVRDAAELSRVDKVITSGRTIPAK
jgi:hypothetical protein